MRYRQTVHITLRTSKPLSRLVKASCNPLLADEILSTTVPIKVRCASEIAACSRRPISASGCAPDSSVLFLLLSLGPNTTDFGWPKGYLLALADQEKSSVTTPQGRPPHEVGRQGEAFRSPSSPEEDPPKTNSVEKGYDPNYKTYVSVIVLGDEAGYIYQEYSCSLTARWRADPFAGTVL